MNNEGEIIFYGFFQSFRGDWGLTQDREDFF